MGCNMEVLEGTSLGNSSPLYNLDNAASLIETEGSISGGDADFTGGFGPYADTSSADAPDYTDILLQISEQFETLNGYQEEQTALLMHKASMENGFAAVCILLGLICGMIAVLGVWLGRR